MLTVLTPAAQAIAVPAAAAAVAAPMSDVVRLLSMVSIARVFSIEPEALFGLVWKHKLFRRVHQIKWSAHSSSHAFWSIGSDPLFFAGGVHQLISILQSPNSYL